MTESPAGADPAPSREAAPGRLYARLWRWHFYAAFLVIPFILLQSVTGTLYLWHEEWADWAHADLRFVAPSAELASYDDQVAAAVALHPQARATTLIVPADPGRSTQVMFGAVHGSEAGLPFPVFVDPHSGAVLGDVAPWAWLPGWTRKVHGGWPLGDPGSWLLELGACWAIVMVLTGLYLWWPRNMTLARALLPRTGAGGRVLLRDLHACVAVWFSVVLMVFLFTALPWTSFWGDRVLDPLQKLIGQASPFGAAARAQPAPPPPGAVAIGIDEIVRAARAAGLEGPLEVKLDVRPGAARSVRNRRDRAAQESSAAFDPYSGALLARTDWADYKAVPRIVATGVDLHEGTFFGRANQWFNTTFALALVWMSVTGALSWWRRRPSGSLGAPPRRAIPLSRGALVTGAVLCVVLPMLGASVALLALGDRLLRPLFGARAAG